MRVVVRHGHFAFYPRDDKDLGKFQIYFKQELEPEQDYYTFPELIGAPNYSLVGLNFLNIPAIKSYEGTPWSIMRENGFVYSVDLGLLVPKETITSMIKIPAATYYALVERPLIQPGSLLLTGQRVLSYDGEYMHNWQQIRLRSVAYE